MIDTADVYSAWVPGHQGGESETVIGRWLKRDPAKRDKVVIATKVGFLDGEIAPENMSHLDPGLARATRRCSGSGSRRSISITSTRTIEKVPLADSLGAFERCVKAGKIRAIGLSQFHAAAARRGDRDRASRLGITAPVALQTWYNLVEREKLEGGAARRGAGARARRSFPSTASPTASSPASTGARRTSTKARAACATSAISKARGTRVLAALDEIAAETGARARDRSRWHGRWRSRGSSRAIASATSVEQLQQLTAAMT